MTTIYASEWAEDPIDLEVRIRAAEEKGWVRDGLPFKSSGGTGVPLGWFVQRLKKEKQ